MNTPISLVAVMLGLLVIAVMLAAGPATNAIGQPSKHTAVKAEHKPATPALLTSPQERALGATGAHRPENTTDGVASTDLVKREGPRATFPGKPIKFTAAGRE